MADVFDFGEGKEELWGSKVSYYWVGELVYLNCTRYLVLVNWLSFILNDEWSYEYINKTYFWQSMMLYLAIVVLNQNIDFFMLTDSLCLCWKKHFSFESSKIKAIKFLIKTW